MLERLAGNTLTAEDRQTLGKVVTFHFWLVFALREAKLSLRRLRVLVFGEPGKREKPENPSSPDGTGTGGGAGGMPGTGPAQKQEPASQDQSAPGKRRRGHGRQRAEAYRGAQRIECHHEDLALGERCPACGRGRLYR